MDVETVICEYQDLFLKEYEDSAFNYYGPKGYPNSQFWSILFSKNADFFFAFLIKISLISAVIKCDKCGSDMKIASRKHKKLDGRLFYCGFYQANSRCHTTKSIRYNSFFKGSKLRISTILLLINEFFRRSSFEEIHKELGIFSQAVSHWRNCVTHVLIDFLVVNTEKIGGSGKVVEIHESKIGKRKYNRGHFIDEQYVLGGVERESGLCFMVGVPDRSEETLIGLIETWIEPETVVVLDCWKTYERLSKKGYEHLTTNHLLEFVNSETDAVESTWHHFKFSWPEYNRLGRFEGYIAWHMFRKISFSMKVDPFIKFLEVISSIDWTDWVVVSGGEVEELNS
ncbi:DDE_Tnp_IS1595 domain-containing protein [Trichonephila clavipes]|nr:DDE_Tnp_IS1595 domain-containing protein [Trichonephila clavipes]